MPPRTLASLAHSLGGAPDLDAALVALGEGLAELDRGAHLALLRYDGRREMLRERLTPNGGRVERSPVETTFDHLPAHVRLAVAAGGQFIDLAEQSDEYARLFGMRPQSEGGWLALRGLRVDGHLAAILALHEARKIFGTRTTERFGAAVALFELAFMRFAEREAREEAVHTLEEVTQKVHGDYLRRLGVLEEELVAARDAASRPVDEPARVLMLEREAASAVEDARRATRRARAVEQQVTAAVEQLERAHIELHRRSEALRQKTRTLYLLERLLEIDTTTHDPRQLVDGMLSLVGDDMQAQRVSLLLRAPEPNMLYLAAARGVAPNVSEGTRIPIGTGVAGKVAQSREPLLVEDVAHANQHPLLRDQYFTTGSFISFPLIYRDELVGVINLTNRAQFGVFVEEDVERVRLLALVLALAAQHARLAERLLETIGVR
jgi:hypothetical protein